MSRFHRRAALLGLCLSSLACEYISSDLPPPPQYSFEHDCLQTHLHDAMDLNQKRKPRYSALTAGRSEAVSDALIGSEQASMLLGKQVDTDAIPFQAKGVPIVCEDFVSISLVPPFAGTFATPPPPVSSFTPLDGAALEKRLEAAFGKGDFAALTTELRAQIDAISAIPWYQCMIRHVLESMLRIATRAPQHAQQAAAKGLSSTLPLSATMIKLHLASVETGAGFDRDAAALQGAGLPIICNDVPPITP